MKDMCCICGEYEEIVSEVYGMRCEKCTKKIYRGVGF